MTCLCDTSFPVFPCHAIGTLRAMPRQSDKLSRSPSFLTFATNLANPIPCDMPSPVTSIPVDKTSPALSPQSDDPLLAFPKRQTCSSPAYSERLTSPCLSEDPPANYLLLLVINDGMRCIGVKQDGEWWIYHCGRYHRIQNVSWWMRLPDLPEETNRRRSVSGFLTRTTSRPNSRRWNENSNCWNYGLRHHAKVGSFGRSERIQSGHDWRPWRTR
jgi:hypothetical protein